MVSHKLNQNAKCDIKLIFMIAFRIWNKLIFGDVEKQARLAIDDVNRIQQLIDTSDFNDALYIKDL